MENFGKPPESRSSVDRIVGGTPEEQASLRESMGARFRDQGRFTDLERHEREKTPFEREAIAWADRVTDAMRGHYGLPPRPIPAENVHILQRNEETERTRKSTFSVYRQAFMVLEGKTERESLKIIFHEMTHFKSFTSIEPDGDDMQDRRLGLTVSKGRERAFNHLNEAVTEELAKRFFRMLEQRDARKETYTLQPQLAASMADMRQGRRDFPKDAEDAMEVIITPKPNGSSDYTFHTFTYPDERKALNLLVNKLAAKLPEKFPDREAAFELFARSMFTGQLLDLARSVEGAFGQGKFRELGEQENGAGFLKFVESL